MDETVDAVDRIAELPTFILHHIISCLHAAEVARTSILSKRWNQLGSQEFVKLVDTSLQRFREIKLVIQKLILYLDLSNDNVLSSQLIDKWIGLAVENGVNNHTLLSEKMILMGTFSISLNSLKKLTLRRVYMNEQMIERLIGERHLLEDLYISGCSVLKDQEFHWLISKFPWLEDLSVMRCFFIERIMISSGLLKHLLIEFCESFKAVDLGIPNLLSFTFESTQIPTISITTSQLCPWKVHFELKEYIIFSDGLFWICYPKSLRLPTMSEGSPAFLEVF
ncbi:hypothetical protein CISIN_1g047453mg [Citrus sinensis]|uniref:F-box domain-containing protein n=1 Tax=Citrus sinensis TaxID=2711 RepID=A0A067EBK0_CITSI|nr:hypothetical protein CISIN_1g047453mg [Citrus sinensis]